MDPAAMFRKPLRTTHALQSANTNTRRCTQVMSHWQNEPLNPSFGVEWEGLIAVAESKYEIQDGEVHQQFYEDVAKLALDENGIPARANDLSRRPDYDIWTIMPDESIHEGSLAAQRPNGKQYLGIEAVSPVLRYSSLQDAAATIEKVLQALNDTCGPVRVNKTTGLHVHVGMAPGSPPAAQEHFPLSTVKNVALLVVALEHVLNTLVPAERLDLTKEPLYVKPLSFMRRAWLVECYFKNPISIWDQLDAIHNAQSNLVVVRALQAEERFVQFNFTNLPQHPGIPRTGTIEFRLLPSSTSPADLVQAVELFVGLAKFAHEAIAAEVDAVVRQALLDPSFGLAAMLEGIRRKDLQKHFIPRSRPLTHIPGMEPPWHPATLDRLLDIEAQSDEQDFVAETDEQESEAQSDSSEIIRW